MMQRPFNVILLLVLATNSLQAQDAIGRDYFLSKALMVLAEYPKFDPGGFDQIRVMSNGQRVYVSFDRQIRYVPKNTTGVYGVLVFVKGDNQISYQHLTNGESDEMQSDPFDIPFRYPSKQERRIIQKISVAMKSQLSPSATLTCYEEDTHYRITIDTDSSSGNYSVDKKSFKVKAEGHRHKALSRSSYYEITDN